MIQAVLFDLDGTLADTAPDLGAALNELRRCLGLAPHPLALLRPFTSQGVRGMLKVGLGLDTTDPTYGLRSTQFLDIYENRLCRDTVLFPGVHDLLSNCASRGIACGVMTNKTQRFTPRLMHKLDLFQRLSCAVSGDSSPRPKPSPLPLLLAARLSGAQPQNCVYVGDDERDIMAGRAAGMITVAVRYGYHGDTTAIETWNADHIVDQAHEIFPLVDR